MKKIGSLWLAALLALPFAVAAQVNSLPSQPHLLVKGQAQREVMPDRFSVNVVLRAVNATPEVARAQVQDDAARVLASYKAHHALTDSVRATTLSIQPAYRFEQNRQVFEGTRVQRSLAATFRNLDDTRQFLASLRTSEGLQLSGITAAFSGEAKLRGELKREAADQTRVSAQELAQAYGVRIAGLYTISDVAPAFAYGVQAGTWPTAMRPGPGGQSLQSPQAPPAPVADIGTSVDPLEAGSITLSENVYAVFLIAQ